MTEEQQANKLLIALMEMRRAYGTFHKGSAYITAAYEKQLAAANAMADSAIQEALGFGLADDHHALDMGDAELARDLEN